MAHAIDRGIAYAVAGFLAAVAIVVYAYMYGDKQAVLAAALLAGSIILFSSAYLELWLISRGNERHGEAEYTPAVPPLWKPLAGAKREMDVPVQALRPRVPVGRDEPRGTRPDEQ